MKTLIFLLTMLICFNAFAQKEAQLEEKSVAISAVGDRIKIPTDGFGKTFIRTMTVWNQITLELDICWYMYGAHSGISCRPYEEK